MANIWEKIAKNNKFDLDSKYIEMIDPGTPKTSDKKDKNAGPEYEMNTSSKGGAKGIERKKSKKSTPEPKRNEAKPSENSAPSKKNEGPTASPPLPKTSPKSSNLEKPSDLLSDNSNQKKHFQNDKELLDKDIKTAKINNCTLNYKQLHESYNFWFSRDADERNFLLALIKETDFGRLTNVPISRNTFIQKYKIQETKFTKTRSLLEADGLIKYYKDNNNETSRKSFFYTLSL